MQVPEGWHDHFDNWRCLWLLLSLMVLIASYPYLVGGADGEGWLYEALFTWVMLWGLYSVARSRRQFAVAALLLLPALLNSWTDLDESHRMFDFVLSLATFAFFSVMSVMVLHYVFTGSKHMTDRLCGALSVYFLMGLAFSQLYHAIYELDSGSFRFPDDSHGPEFTRFLYLSFVTQTTMGYGDITPSAMSTESLTILQSSLGVMYLAVLVAWLVGSARPFQEMDRKSDRD